MKNPDFGYTARERLESAFIALAVMLPVCCISWLLLNSWFASAGWLISPASIGWFLAASTVFGFSFPGLIPEFVGRLVKLFFFFFPW